jgi:tetratricopeptide (TPR) repeat protein
MPRLYRRENRSHPSPQWQQTARLLIFPPACGVFATYVFPDRIWFPLRALSYNQPMHFYRYHPDFARRVAPRSPRWWSATAWAGVWFCLATAAGARPALPLDRYEGRSNPLESRLLADAADGRLDEHSLLRAALIASGLQDPAALLAYEERVARWDRPLRVAGAQAGKIDPTARVIFEFMHRQILVGGYHQDSTDLLQTIDSGRFNCVSATLLYSCLAERFGLSARGLEYPGHVMSRLLSAGGPLDVESTCPRWFELLDDPQQQQDLLRQALGTHGDYAAKVARRREVSPVQLVAMIYYNRGVDLLAQLHFPEALAADAKALRLDPANAAAWGNLSATLNNWAISLSSVGLHSQAAEKLNEGLAIDPDYPTFAANYVHVHYQWVEQLCQGGRFEDALTVLQRAAARRPAETYFRAATLDVYRRWARARLAAGHFAEAAAVFDRAAGSCPDRLAVLEAEIAAVNDRAIDLLEAKRFEDAVRLLDAGLARHADVALWSENRRTAVMHWAEAAFRSGDYREAIRRTTDGAVPGKLPETLLNNVRYGYYQWAKELRAAGRSEEACAITRLARSDPFLLAAASVGVNSADLTRPGF